MEQIINIKLVCLIFLCTKKKHKKHKNMKWMLVSMKYLPSFFMLNGTPMFRISHLSYCVFRFDMPMESGEGFDDGWINTPLKQENQKHHRNQIPDSKRNMWEKSAYICLYFMLFWGFFHFILFLCEWPTCVIHTCFKKWLVSKKALILKSGKILPIIAKQIQLNLSQSKCSLH